MLTARGWWFLMSVLALLLVGGCAGHVPLLVLTLTLVLWFCGEWLAFGFRAAQVLPTLRVCREVTDEHGPAGTLWAGRTFDVRVTVELGGWQAVPYLAVSDRVPYGADWVSGSAQSDGEGGAEKPHVLAYRLRCPGAGRVRFEGVAVRFADLQGFFYTRVFLNGPVELRVLPPLLDAGGHGATVKRHNLLPSPGQHRHRRPGSGSELLDLRDYLPGDPPKTIAWKVSARRDRLITKEFESEVPVRCTLFVDTSDAVRLGTPGRNALARLVAVATAVAQAAVAARDLVGACLFDDKGVSSAVRPARTRRHLLTLLGVLGDAAGRSAVSGRGDLVELMRVAEAFAHEVYPGLMSPAVNRVPWWLPVLWPLPWRARRRAGLWRWAYRVGFFGGVFAVGAAAVTAVYALVGFEWVAEVWDVLLGPLFPGPAARVVAVAFLLGAAVLGYRILEAVYAAVPLLFSARNRRYAARRKRLAALLAFQNSLGASGVAELLEDDARMKTALQRFLSAHQVPYTQPLYDAEGNYLFASADKVRVLAEALLQAVGKGRDNELLVLMADLLELSEGLEPLVVAVKVARARHHQVLVVCPWPPEVPPPGEPLDAKSFLRWDEPDAEVQALLRRATAERYHRAYHGLRRTFTRLGVSVLCAAADDSVRLILERFEQLRVAGKRR